MADHDRFTITDDELSLNNTAGEHWTSVIGRVDDCPNCGVQRAGKYCIECGQRHLDGRLKFAELIKELFSRVTDLERGLLHTFVDMMVHPGVVVRDYVMGKQKPYVNPLTYFFIGTALTMISLFLCQSILVENMQKSFGRDVNGPARAQLDKIFDGDGALGVAECYITAVQQGYAYLAFFCFCFPFAVLLRWFHALPGGKFRLAETMVFSLFCFGQMLIITAFLTPITIRIGTSVQLIAALATYIVFPLHAHTSFFRSTWTARLLTILATVISSLLFFSSIVVIFFVTVVVTIMWRAA